VIKAGLDTHATPFGIVLGSRQFDDHVGTRDRQR
jgi:hypothetical protein